MAESTTKRGNPSFLKKQQDNSKSKYEKGKRYQFKLIQTHEKVKPRDRDTNEILDNPYPPLYFISNSGVGINPKTNEVENWRYVFGFPSIWVSEQEKPTPNKGQLENPKNFIEFKNGSLFVMGSNSALMDALLVQDIFDGVDNPYEEKEKIYTLINEGDARKKVREDADLAFTAEKYARECTLGEMIPVAMAFGIDVDDPEENEDRIRTEFILKAKANPAGFNVQYTNPKNQVKYNITQALRNNIISSELTPGRITMVSTGKTYCDIREGDVAEQFARLYVANNNEAHALYQNLETVLAGE